MRRLIISKKSEFTLIEMILAMFIFLIVVLLIGTCMFTLQQSMEKVTGKSDYLSVYQRLDRVFNTSFRNAVPFYWNNPTGSKTTIFSGGPDNISFAYLHRVADVSDGGIRFLVLRVENGNLVAYYKKVPILPWDQTTLMGATKEVLASKISNISFSYAGFDQQAQMINWTPAWTNQFNSYNIPLAISIRVTWQDNKSETWLRRTAGSGRYESLGMRF